VQEIETERENLGREEASVVLSVNEGEGGDESAMCWRVAIRRHGPRDLGLWLGRWVWGDWWMVCGVEGK
jgi:hypothetical protein